METNAKRSAFLQTSRLPMTMSTLGNSDDTSCQTKLYQTATSFSLSTFGPKTIHLNLFVCLFKYPYQICSQTLTELSHMSAALNLENKCSVTSPNHIK